MLFLPLLLLPPPLSLLPFLSPLSPSPLSASPSLLQLLSPLQSSLLQPTFLVILSLRCPLVVVCKLVVVSPLVVPPSRPLVVPPSHRPLTAPPSCCLVSLAGCCIASCHTALSSPSHSAALIVLCWLVVATPLVALPSRCVTLLLCCPLVLSSSSHCAVLSLSHLTSCLLRSCRTALLLSSHSAALSSSCAGWLLCHISSRPPLVLSCKGGRWCGGNCLSVDTAPLPCCGRACKASKRMFSWSSLSMTSLKIVFFCKNGHSYKKNNLNWNT